MGDLGNNSLGETFGADSDWNCSRGTQEERTRENSFKTFHWEVGERR